MRKSATLAKREAEKGSSSSPQSSSSQTSQPVSTAYNDQGGNDIEHHSEPSDSDDDESGNGPVTFQEKIHFEEPQRPRSQRRHSRTDSGIKFSALPHPRRRKSIDPEDMYRSINMLQEHKKNQEAKSKGIQFLNIGSPVRRKSRSSNIEAFPEEDTNPSRDDEITPATNSVGTGNNDEDEDDILIIKPPIEIENSDEQTRFSPRRRNLHHRFNLKRPSGKQRNGLPRKRANIITLGQANTEDDSEDEEYASIDSETSDISDNEHAADNAEGSDVDSDETGGKKYTKRSNTLDTPQQNTSDGRKIRKKAPKRKTPRTQRNASFNQHSNVSIGDGSIENVDTNDSYQRLSRTMSGNYLSWTPTVGRNSTFIKLTDEQKEELGGIEYRAVKLLIKIIVVYYVGFNIIPGVMLSIWIYCMPHYKNLMISSSISPAWWAFFTSQSSFNDLGLTLTSNSMMSFNQNAFVQILCSFLIVIGNTGFPILLRFIIWVMFKTARPLSLYKESLGFLLDHPRRCFTLLFPSVPTWWLFFILVVLNGFDLVIFCILDLHDDTFKGVDMGYRVLNGLFQAFCTRTVGFSVMDLSQLHAATQVSYLIMMYISVLPIAISVRRTNVYEEQSLGVYAKENAEGVDESAPSNYVGSHLRNQLSYDLWYICLGLFIICIAEGKRLKEQDLRFSIFAVLFEIVSAYGTVGMSMGYPGVDCSLSGEFNVISKLVIIAMMIRGRHRGLPYTIDRAIMLPNAAMKRHDRLQEEHAINSTILWKEQPR
ncbi:potassium uptake protein, Trk family protein [Candida albicans]|uniref:Potassium transport protein n=1 Tax=Candida albicans TaxID=5476 RepID=A0A8H6BYD4_CANAX|nr:potassium uptake protein, Trk family protein [Candida albicans]